ncbi:MAG: 3-phosphoshikimate 1-carboxyvinyltransferase [Chromatiales bacterium]|nr:3-phosphoshikimate 1-carboxyvinyltransferase [Chromatiales bacterium]
MEYFTSRPAAEVGGSVCVPGDKSISHRALMLGAIAQGDTEVTGFLAGEDCLATLAALRAMGVQIEQDDPGSLVIRGVGLHGLSAAGFPLDMGNSGTAMRLFAGLLAAQRFDSVLVGDASLSRRPMERVAAPLRLMGADISTREGLPPLDIRGGMTLSGIDYTLPVASAQVKSAILLAALYAQGPTTVSEPGVTRDHTERMLRQFGVSLQVTPGQVRLKPGQRLAGTRVAVPGDLSSAAFPILAACLAPRGRLELVNVGLNPTRTGIIEILRRMGARIEVRQDGSTGVEPVGTIVVEAGRLHGIEVPAELVPLAIDEFPVLFVAAALAEGDTVVRGAAELRHKESDRIARMAAGLAALGGEVTEFPDGALIRGGRLQGGKVDSAGDHRIAMAFAVAAVAAEGPVRIRDTANVATSFPGFADLAGRIGMDLSVSRDGD